jgi:hypothetical protein
LLFYADRKRSSAVIPVQIRVPPPVFHPGLTVLLLLCADRKRSSAVIPGSNPGAASSFCQGPAGN